MSRLDESDPVRSEIFERRLGGVPVLVGLSPAQVDPLVRGAAEAGNLLAAFPQDGRSMRNAEVSRLLGLGTSTTHRYISTLVAVDLLDRDPTTRQYGRTHAG